MAATAERRAGERGQVLVLFTLGLTVFLLAAAITFDFGFWLSVRRDYQNVADAAVLAGSPFLTRPIGEPCGAGIDKPTCARREAWRYINDQLGLGLAPGQIVSFASGNTSQGAPEVVPVPGGTPFNIWVSTPPGGAGTDYIGAYATDRRKLWARIDRVRPTFFSRIAAFADPNISAWATSGSHPNRFAVITLRRPGQAPGSIGEDINLAGNSILEVIDGDVGGNWNMKLNSGSQLWVRGANDNDADTYLIEWQSCGNSCWTTGQVNSGPNGNPPNVINQPDPLPGVLDDPNYPLPAALTPPPTTPVPPAVPLGQGNTPLDTQGVIDVRNGGPNVAPGGASLDGSGVLTCDPLSPRIGPGYYSSITVRSGKCLILDPTLLHTSVVAAVPDVPTPVPGDQLPGIFYINGTIDINSDALLVGDRVTLIMRPGSSNQLDVKAGGVVSLNRGASPGAPAGRRLGAWMTNGTSPYSYSSLGGWQYQTSLEASNENVGMALYVIKREQYTTAAADDSSNVVVVNALGGLAWDGLSYAPHDNVTLAGRPGHDGVGQLVAWTFKFAGNVAVKQTYLGPDIAIPRLFEPTLGQ
ncbi:MAG TPA: Tad domain-containing protein [Candidatus Limnocylindrales bacterium]|nr:Tad domain-containing protein [Candidatus Limnocylindrales bacterium]